MRVIREIWFGKCTASSLSSRLYALLWFFGLCSAIASYVEMRHETLLGARLGDFVVFLLAAATIAQQWTIYSDIHFIEDSPDAASLDYPKWLNMRLERAIRLLVIFFLLFGVGKIADSFYPLAERIQCGAIRNAITEFLRPSDTTTHFSRNLFVTGSLAVFTLLTIWNSFALWFRIQEWPRTDTIAESVHKWIVTIRIGMFIILSFLCSLYWYFVFVDSPAVRDIAEMIILLYICTAILVMLLRLTQPRQWLENSLVQLIDRQPK